MNTHYIVHITIIILNVLNITPNSTGILIPIITIINQIVYNCR